MANLQKIIKVTQAQYNTLAAGGTVGSYTGLDNNYIYLVEEGNKTYTGLIGTTNNWIGCNFFFINVKPISWQAEWTVRYRLECELDDGLTPTYGEYMHSTHECFMSGSRGLFNNFANFNNINNTSYRVVGYGIIAKTTETGYNAGYGHMIGISLYYDGLAYQNRNTDYMRTIKVTIIEAINCTVTLEDEPLISHNASRTDYTKLNSTYYPYSSSESNTAGYLTTLDLYSNGLRETGDDNNTDLLYYHNQWTPVSSTLGLPGYTIFGFNPAGEAMSISIANPSSPATSDAITTNRSYNSGGFDWTKGLLRNGGGTYWAASTTNLTHAYKVQNFNLKYTDNLVNAASTNLTMVANKHVYFRGTIGTDGLFYLAPISVTYNGSTYQRVWTQDIPTTEDGYVYWLIGHAYSGSSATVNVQDIRLYAENPLYWYKDGVFREYLQNSNIINGTGTNAVRQKMADATVNFAGRNPNAEALDSTISTTINTGASGNQSSAFGKNTMALSTATLTHGNKTLAKGEESHAEGYQSVTLGNGSHAEGEATVSYGEVSHSEGSNTQSLGTASHAEGVRSKTLTISGVTDSGNAAHAEGESTTAAGYGSHTEGFGSYTGPIANAPSYPITPEPEPSPTPTPTPVTFYGNMAHAEGNYCFAVGTGSHAEGYHTQALHEAAHASGVGTKTYRSGQFVTGWYNATPSSDDLFVIGNGTADNARSNIFVVSLDGKVTAPTFVGNLNGNATSATTATSATSASTATIAQTANLVNINADSSYAGALLVNSSNNVNTVVRKDNITVTSDGRLTVGAGPTNNLDVATKGYVDSCAATKYQHNIIVQYVPSSQTDYPKASISFTIINNSSAAINTISGLTTAMGISGDVFAASGIAGTTTKLYQIIGVYSLSSNFIITKAIEYATVSGTDLTINLTLNTISFVTLPPTGTYTISDTVRTI